MRFGLICSPVGCFVGVMIWLVATGDGYWRYLLYSSVAALITPATCWYVLVERKELTRFRGVLAGFSGAVMGHVLVFILNIIAIDLQMLLERTFFEPQNGVKLLLLELQALPIQIIFSLVFFGWLTLPMGGFIGGSYAQRIAESNDITHG